MEAEFTHFLGEWYLRGSFAFILGECRSVLHVSDLLGSLLELLWGLDHFLRIMLCSQWKKKGKIISCMM